MKSQRGGFVMGLVVGLLAGLALALGVALYVTKVPVPFVNKVPQRTAEQDAAEAEKNKNWDPNSPLYGKNPARPAVAASGLAIPTPDPAASATAVAPEPHPPAPVSSRDPAALLGGKAVATVTSAKASQPVSTATATDPFSYFVQAGAYAHTEDAEQQRARIAMLGYEAKLTEREQSGRTVYRVRVGPFDSKDEADATKEKLNGAGVDAALVRVQR
jgi:cell division protein FtsN